MIIVLTLAFLVMAVGILLLLNINPNHILAIFNKEKSNDNITLKDIINKSRKKPSFIQRFFIETKEILKMTNRANRFAWLCFFAILGGIFGLLFAINISTYILIPVFVLAFAICPFLYVILSKGRLMKDLNFHLRTALFMITTGYMRTGTIITAIEESVEDISSPAKEIFIEFLNDVKLNPSIKNALLTLKYKIDDDIFHEWVDAVIACQYDSALRDTLIPIVEKYSDIQYITGELETYLYRPIKEFLTMSLLLVGNIPLLKALNDDWFYMLFNTIPGQLILGSYVIVLLVGLVGVVKLTRPLEYYR
ncbi:MAG: hypothetical protein RR385_08470 [Clostridiales bacterium]